MRDLLRRARGPRHAGCAAVAERSAADRLRGIVGWGGRAVEHIGGMAPEAPLADRRTQGALVRRIGVIGEAAGVPRRTAPGLAARRPGMRAREAHEARNRLGGGWCLSLNSGAA